MNAKWLAGLAVLGLIGATGCNRPDSAESAESTIQDVAEAQQEGAQEIAAAKRSASEIYQENEIDPEGSRAPALRAEADAAYQVEVAEIESAMRVASERCEGSNAPQEKNDCLDRAKAEFDSRISAARSRRDGVKQDAEALEESAPRVGTGNLLAA